MSQAEIKTQKTHQTLMKKSLLTLGCIFSLGTVSICHAALSTGSIAFTGFNADGTDGFSFAALTTISASESIFFRDDEWDGTSFGSGEAEFLWTAPGGGLAAGTVVVFSDISSGVGSGAAVNFGSLSGTAFGDSAINLSGSNEALWAFQGSSNNPTTFLAMISNDFGGDGSSLTGTGLVLGSTAIDLKTGSGDPDVAAFASSRSDQSSFSSYGSIINNNSNWEFADGTGDQSGDVAWNNATAFTAVPEPHEYALLVGGLLATVVFFRRRQASRA